MLLNQQVNRVVKPRKPENQKPEKDIEGSGKKPDPRIRKIFDFWASKYEKQYGRKYAFNGKKEGDLIKKALTVLEPRPLCERINLFFETEDPFILKAGHTIGVFYATINRPLDTATADPQAPKPRTGPDPVVKERRALDKDRQENPEEYMEIPENIKRMIGE